MTPGLDYVAHLTRESAHFAETIREAPPDAPVPSCADWTADDLLWHRPPVAPVERSGDQQVLSRFESAIAPGID